jgi:GNAT superfamily N-acetyltransferase
MTAYKEIIDNKKKYLSLLLLADEQESMIDTYLERGRLYVLEDGGVRAVCVVTDEGDGVLEIKNLAVSPPWQRCGYGRAFVEYIRRRYRGAFHTLQVGTGDSTLTIPFYEACGFVKSHCVRNFFIDHYDHPIYEGGVRLVDMIYLRRDL